LSKILFDLISCWSFRSIKHETHSIQITTLKLFILNFMNKKLSTKDILDVKMLIFIDFLRVLSYTKNQKDKNLLQSQLKNYYDNFNNPLRW